MLNLHAPNAPVNEEPMNRLTWLARRLWLGAVVLAACAPASTPPPEPAAIRPPSNMPTGWPMFARTKADTAPSGMVVSGSPIASAVGADVLKQGGNAVDAAVAVAFALAVAHPEAGNIGGGGFMVLRFANSKVAALDYRETAPGRATRDMYLDAQGKLTDKSLTRDNLNLLLKRENTHRFAGGWSLNPGGQAILARRRIGEDDQGKIVTRYHAILPLDPGHRSHCFNGVAPAAGLIVPINQADPQLILLRLALPLPIEGQKNHTFRISCRDRLACFIRQIIAQQF